MKPLSVLGLFLMVALAGCTEDPESTTTTNSEGVDGEPETSGSLGVPEWAVGDYWTYSTSAGSTWSLVVTEDTGSHYVLDTDDVDMAFRHDQIDELGFVGPMDKQTVAGTEDGQAVQYFDWPLEHEKSWRTQFDGETYDLVAHKISDNTFHIIASQNGVAVHQYQYDANIGFFEWFSWGDAEGNEQFRIDLEASGSNFDGELIRVNAVIAYQGNHNGPTGAVDAAIDSSDATEDADAYLVFNLGCNVGEFAFGIGTLQGIPSGMGLATPTEPQGHGVISACPIEVSFADVIGTVPGNGDQWGMYLESSSPDFEIDYTLYWRNFERIEV